MTSHKQTAKTEVFGDNVTKTAVTIVCFRRFT